MASHDSFIERYRQLSDEIEAFIPNLHAADNVLWRFMDRQGELYKELRAHPTLSDNNTLLTLDSAVMEKLTQKQLDCFRYVAAN